MSKVFVLVLSTAVDYIVRTDGFRRGHVIKALSNRLVPSGKGVNTARTIAALGQDVCVVGFVGKDRQELFTEETSPRITTSWHVGDWRTRMNVTIVNTDGSLVSHIRAQAEPVAKHRLKELLADLFSRVRSGDVLVLSGSIPKSFSPETYGDIIKRCRRIGVLTVLDAEGDVLRIGLRAQPTVAKPNMAELHLLFPSVNIQDATSIRHAIQLGLASSSTIVFLSQGSKGVLVYQPGNTEILRGGVRLTKERMLGEEIGCGDAMVGGLATSLARGYSMEQMIRLGVACGASNLLQPVPGQVRLTDVKRLTSLATIRSTI